MLVFRLWRRIPARAALKPAWRWGGRRGYLHARGGLFKVVVVTSQHPDFKGQTRGGAHQEARCPALPYRQPLPHTA